jgi:glycosyltransferase involved in cell wall biosynthesis
MPDEREPLVSVVIPFLDAERFLSEAVESVRAQTCSRWELLLVDDGSRDDSTAIAREYAAREPDRIRYLEHEGHRNRGISASRNVGAYAGSGPLIAMLDADDVWLPHKLAEQVALLAAHPEAAMVYGRSQYWYGWTSNPADAARDTLPSLGVSGDTVVDPPELLVRCLRGEATVPCPCSIVVRRNVYERVGGFEAGFTGVLAAIEDQAFYAKVMLDEPVLVADRWWDRYRQHPDSVYSRAKREGWVLDARLRYLEWLRAQLTARKMPDGSLSRAVRAAEWRVRYPRLARTTALARALVTTARHVRR